MEFTQQGKFISQEIIELDQQNKQFLTIHQIFKLSYNNHVLPYFVRHFINIDYHFLQTNRKQEVPKL